MLVSELPIFCVHIVGVNVCAHASVYINTAGGDRTGLRASVGDFIKNKSHLIIWIGTNFYCVTPGFGVGLAFEYTV